ncbi:MAG: cupin domain-containing protein [Candidatus Caenarcaniphilales bacterium]|nr:cupin domain-containing protein [Candidatus Caenarcaniphilales bacterium]
MKAEELIKHLNLKPHPEEGGFYYETYRSEEFLTKDAMNWSEYSGDRSYATAIYYLLTPETFSEMHILPTDEMFHFYYGDPIEMLQLLPDGSGKTIKIGRDFKAGMYPQVLIPKGVWQGSRLIPGGEFALIGATMSPGFHFDDYRGGTRKELTEQYPDFKDLIEVLTKR